MRKGHISSDKLHIMDFVNMKLEIEIAGDLETEKSLVLIFKPATGSVEYDIRNHTNELNSTTDLGNAIKIYNELS